VWWFKKKEKYSEEMAGNKKSILGSRDGQAGAGRKTKLEEEKERRRRKKKEKEEKKAKEKKISAQNTIPYREMAKDGTCRVKEHTYSRTIRFYDINYQLAQNEDKSAIFESWCDFLNYFDSSIHVQLSFINHKSSM
jgi:hypothetical protein